jgi:hypothetical protein
MVVKLSYSLTNVDINKTAVDFVFNEPTGDVGRWMRRRGNVALHEAKATVGVDTGKLRTAIKMTHDRKGPGRMQQIRIGTGTGSNRGYAMYHHEGTKPHVITPKKTGRLLTFNVRGKRVFAKVVKHPGTKPNPYLTRTFKVFMGN